MIENIALQKAIEAQDLTQSEVAERALVTRESINRYVTGRSRPHSRLIAESVARAVGVPAPVIFPHLY